MDFDSAKTISYAYRTKLCTGREKWGQVRDRNKKSKQTRERDADGSQSSSSVKSIFILHILMICDFFFYHSHQLNPFSFSKFFASKSKQRDNATPVLCFGLNLQLKPSENISAHGIRHVFLRLFWLLSFFSFFLPVSLLHQ